MELHLPSILSQAALATAAVTLGVGLVALRARRPYLGDWALSMCTALVGMVLFGLRGVAPDWLSVVGANAFFTCSLALTLSGHLRFAGLRLWPRTMVGTGLALVLAYIALTYAYPSYPWRVALFNTSLALVSLVCCGVLWDQRQRLSLVTLAMPLVAHGLQALVAFARLGLTVLEDGDSQELLSTSLPHMLAIMVNTLAVMAMGFGYMALHSARLMEALEAQAATDALTGLLNRRGFDGAASQEWRRHQRAGTSLAVLMIDVDHFKRLNDKQGHAAGDAALRQLGAVVQQHIRPYDVAARLGGEEFCVLVVDGALPAALQTAERLRLAVQEASRSEPSAAAVTISVGVSEALPDDPGLAAVMARADAALYRAKQAGRNRVELA